MSNAVSEKRRDCYLFTEQVPGLFVVAVANFQ